MASFFYPGNKQLALKAVWHFFILLTIGPNLFLDHLQDRIFKIVEHTLILSDTLAVPVVQSAIYIEDYVLPIYQKMEHHKTVKEVIDYLEAPDAADIQKGLNKVHQFKETLEGFIPQFQLMGYVLKITSFFIWIPISLSMLWLTIHFFKTQKVTTRWLILTGFAFAFIWNIAVFECLEQTFLETVNSPENFIPVLQNVFGNWFQKFN